MDFVNSLCASLALPKTVFAAGSTIFHFVFPILARYNCLSLSTSATFLSTNQIIMTASLKPTYPKEITFNSDLTCTSTSEAASAHQSHRQSFQRWLFRDIDHSSGDFFPPDDNHICGDSSHIYIILVVTFLPIDDDHSRGDSSHI
jgi:hypothetical protein